MNQVTVTVNARSSAIVEQVGVIISVQNAFVDNCEVVIGYPGLPNVKGKLLTGDAILYETTQYVIIEVRAIAHTSNQATFLVTQVSPRIGLRAGAVDTDITNTPFTPVELTHISESIASLKQQLQNQSKLIARAASISLTQTR